SYFFCFFFQAEDGIRDGHVTGVQTCALPILLEQVMKKWFDALEEKRDLFKQGYVFFNNHFAGFGPGSVNEFRRLAGLAQLDWKRSEERRVGKECRSGCWRYQ